MERRLDGESLVFGHAEDLKDELLELWNSPDSPSRELLAKLVWESAAVRPAFYGLAHSEVFPRCLAHTPPLRGVWRFPTETILKADLSESQFLRLTSAVARLTDSPLGISMSPEDEHLGERLELARWAPGAEVGICDWILSPAEVRVAQRSELRIIALGDSPVGTD